MSIRINSTEDLKPVFLVLIETADILENKLKDGFQWTDLTAAWTINKKVKSVLDELPEFWEDFRQALKTDPKSVYTAIQLAKAEYEANNESDHPVTDKIAKGLELLARNYWKGNIAKDHAELEIAAWKDLLEIE